MKNICFFKTKSNTSRLFFSWFFFYGLQVLFLNTKLTNGTSILKKKIVLAIFSKLNPFKSRVYFVFSIVEKRILSFFIYHNFFFVK